MRQKALTVSGGGLTFEIDQDNCYSAEVTKNCTNALVIIGNKTTSPDAYDQQYVGVVENGTLTQHLNWSNRYNVSYNSGVLSMRGGYNSNYGWIKIAYN